MFKKMMAVLLAATLMFTALAYAETDAGGLAEGADSDWYMQVLADPELSEQFPYHCFADINANGVPVLIVSTTAEAFIGNEDLARVYLYDAGAPSQAMEIGGGAGAKLFANYDNQTLTYYYRMSGEAHIEVYAAKDGALTLVTKADRYDPNHGPAEKTDAESFFQDDQEIAPEAGEALFARYAGDEDAVSYETLGMANPWTDMTEEQLLEASGVAFGVPEGAEDVAYRWLEGEGIAEMQFTLDGDEYCARVKSAALEIGQLEDISGMYFDWVNVEEITIGGYCEGTIGQAQAGSEDFVELCLWYDLVPGLMYSLSVHTPELNGLDLTAVAEMVYVPMQGDD